MVALAIVLLVELMWWAIVGIMFLNFHASSWTKVERSDWKWAISVSIGIAVVLGPVVAILTHLHLP